MCFDYRAYSLKEHFDEFNQRYWNGHLPSGPIVWIKDARYMSVGAHAQFDFDEDEPYSRCWRIKILIPTAESEDFVSGLLLHEMIHLQLKNDPTEWSPDPNFHGEKFRARAAELEQITGYDIKDKGVVAEQLRSWAREHNRKLLMNGNPL